MCCSGKNRYCIYLNFPQTEAPVDCTCKRTGKKNQQRKRQINVIRTISGLKLLHGSFEE